MDQHESYNNPPPADEYQDPKLDVLRESIYNVQGKLESVIELRSKLENLLEKVRLGNTLNVCLLIGCLERGGDAGKQRQTRSSNICVHDCDDHLLANVDSGGHTGYEHK